MPPYFPRWFTKLLIVGNVITLLLDLLLYFFAPDARPPGMLNSAIGAGIVALWFALLGQYRQDAQTTRLGLPFVVIMLFAFFGYTSYLCSALMSAAFIYLFVTDLHAQP